MRQIEAGAAQVGAQYKTARGQDVEVVGPGESPNMVKIRRVTTGREVDVPDSYVLISEDAEGGEERPEGEQPSEHEQAPPETVTCPVCSSQVALVASTHVPGKVVLDMHGGGEGVLWCPGSGRSDEDAAAAPEPATEKDPRKDCEASDIAAARKWSDGCGDKRAAWLHVLTDTVRSCRNWLTETVDVRLLLQAVDYRRHRTGKETDHAVKALISRVRRLDSEALALWEAASDEHEDIAEGPAAPEVALTDLTPPEQVPRVSLARALEIVAEMDDDCLAEAEHLERFREPNLRQEVLNAIGTRRSGLWAVAAERSLGRSFTVEDGVVRTPADHYPNAAEAVRSITPLRPTGGVEEEVGPEPAPLTIREATVLSAQGVLSSLAEGLPALAALGLHVDIRITTRTGDDQ